MKKLTKQQKLSFMESVYTNSDFQFKHNCFEKHSLYIQSKMDVDEHMDMDVETEKEYQKVFDWMWQNIFKK